MVKFGHLKSKIEKILVESYQKGTFKYEMKNFKTKVLENKKISKAFHLYSELCDNKELSESIAKDFVDESVKLYRSLGITKKDTQDLTFWLKDVNCENIYKDIDNLISDNVLDVIGKLKSKGSIVETLTSKKEVVEPKAQIPLSSMLKIANNTFATFIGTLDENEQKELINIIKLDDKELSESFGSLQENTVIKLETLLENENDGDLKNKISETIKAIKEEKIDRLSFLKLKRLNDTI